MKKMITILVCISMILSFCSCTVRPTSKVMSDEEIRLISTSVALCYILDELELNLVGVPQSSFELPHRYDDITRVGLPMTPDLEIIKTLRPTEILSPNSLQYDLKPQYESVKIPSTFVNLMSVEGMFKSIQQLGEKYDRKEKAEALINDHNSFMEEYNKKTGGRKKPRVLILMGLPGAYMVTTEKAYVGNLVKLAGGENVFGSDEGAFLNVNTESILATDPDIILRCAHGLPEEAKKMFAKEFKENDIWKHFRAVQEGKVYDLDYNVFNMSASLRYKDGLNKLQKLLFE